MWAFRILSHLTGLDAVRWACVAEGEGETEGTEGDDDDVGAALGQSRGTGLAGYGYTSGVLARISYWDGRRCSREYPAASRVTDGGGGCAGW